MTHNLWVILGLLGIVVLRYPARLAFDRRNQYGVEEFASYGHMRRRRWLERGIKFAGLALIIVALQHGCMSTRHYAPTHAVGASD